MYRVKFETFVIGGNEYVIRSLQDRQQFHDPKGIAESMGILSATWSLFGNVWPSGLILADIMSTYDVAGLHILEVGCGLGIASLIANERGAWHTASDHHPLAGYFLHENNMLNNLPPIHFERCDWAGPISSVGLFDLIIGSDLLYEPHHPALLSNFISLHSAPLAKVIIIDPERRQQSNFNRQMEQLGFTSSFTRPTEEQEKLRNFKGKILEYSRNSQ
jgi:predicted nicotinamide N-methyase